MPITRPPDKASAPSAKHPATELSEYDQLVVEPSECAVLARGTQLFGVVGPGRHTLSSQALPFLDALRGPAPGVFSSSVLFVTTQPFEIKLGGPLRALGNTMAFGSLTVRAADPGLFATSMGGATADELARWFGPKVLCLVERCAQEWLAAGHFTQQTLGQAGPVMTQNLAPHLGFLSEHGLQLVRFDSLTINAR